MGKMHSSRFTPGQRINNSFTLVRNFIRKTSIKRKNEWLWECKCDCGKTFTCRENKLLNRRGCQSCTNKITQRDVALKKKNGIEHIGLKNRLLKDYKSGAVKRGKQFELTFEQFINIVEQDCYYCGAKPVVHQYEIQYMQTKLKPWAHNGIDRIDSNKGYTIDNCVPCCSKCNYAKHTMSVDEFKSYIKSRYKHFVLKGSTTILIWSTLQTLVVEMVCIPIKLIKKILLWIKI